MIFLRVLYVLIAITFISCGIKGPNDYDFFANRLLVSDIKVSEQISSNKDLKTEYSNSYFKSLKDNKFADGLYQKRNGSVNRFFIKENKFNFYCWSEGEASPQKIVLSEDYAFGLIIGQSKDNLYFYNSSGRGKNFARYNFNTKTTLYTSLQEDFTIINITEIQNDDGLYLVSGVNKNKPYNKLGFYHINVEGEVIEIIKEFDYKYSPDGDPSIYSGIFYNYGEHIFFVFDNKANVYHFNKNGQYIKEIVTIDQFDFKHASNKAYSPLFEGLYKDLFISSNKLFIRTNIINTKDNYIFFDEYNVEGGNYKQTYKVAVPNMNFMSSGNPIWSYIAEDDYYHLLLGANFQSGAYKEYKIKL